MKKINKHFYLQEQTINEIKEYADKNKMTASDVVEMLWTEFKAKKDGEYEKKIEEITEAVKEAYAPCFEELKTLSQNIEDKGLEQEHKEENSIGDELKQISENLKQIEEALKKK